MEEVEEVGNGEVEEKVVVEEVRRWRRWKRWGRGR